LIITTSTTVIAPDATTNRKKSAKKKLVSFEIIRVCKLEVETRTPSHLRYVHLRDLQPMRLEK